ncbi:tetraacyldisaccharide 4'-kinase [Rhodoferax sp. GW822-FHT02A01]|uniref:tetraacyldisaccharide 4'-kinase n=1 Tax=Rhodoferax sp. GW822-FHT02A01 TaxID=3141537 RepID=UPI00315D4DA6
MGVGHDLPQKLGMTLVSAWQRRGVIATLLLPISLVYAALVFLRRWTYQSGLRKAKVLDRPVIVVGNAIAGGAGKTPTTVSIVLHLRSRGWKVGVVSRGYGRQSDDVRAVSAKDNVASVGDEPLLIARATDVPVYVGRDRHAAASALLMQHPDTQLLVCDDGLQHYALYRDIEVCVFDDRGVGNGWMLPAGPLREPWPRKALQAVGQDDARLLVLHTGLHKRLPGFSAERSLDRHAVDRHGAKIEIATLRQPLLALAGIARPEAFFSSLTAMGIALDKSLPLPDHFDFQSLNADLLQGYQVLCTEKDAAKLWEIWPDALAVPLIQTQESAFWVALDGLVDDVRRTKLSSTHGHQTA